MKITQKTYARGLAARALAFTFAFGLAACTEAEKPTVPEIPKDKSDFKVSLDASGKFALVDANGRSVGQECSTDPKAANVCELFKPGHKVQVEEITNISVVKYVGSQCVTAMSVDSATGRLRAITFCY